MLAGVSLSMSAVWLSVVADEVVALLQALGHILGITTVRPAPHIAHARALCVAGLQCPHAKMKQANAAGMRSALSRDYHRVGHLCLSFCLLPVFMCPQTYSACVRPDHVNMGVQHLVRGQRSACPCVCPSKPGVQDIIGGTVLSWGENVPEVVATLTLARAGQGTMALAACFAGPMFNLAVRGTLLLGRELRVKPMRSTLGAYMIIFVPV